MVVEQATVIKKYPYLTFLYIRKQNNLEKTTLKESRFIRKTKIHNSLTFSLSLYSMKYLKTFLAKEILSDIKIGFLW